MFLTYDKSGVSLAYPENWRLEEDSDEDARLNLTITSPNTAFWTLIVYTEALDLDHVLDQTLAALREEYPEIEIADADQEIAGQSIRGKDASFFCLDLTSTTRLRALHRGASTYLILSQAEDREMKVAGAVFDAITQSLLAGTGPLGGE
ncbi:hypothetical protein [Botrimarina mediterranea]|uniref:DUF1795 domain-containing protein n=1 Tax=Botrimarina mediterranea TaxID=2528022 RepID=A0A518KAM0_9BACT|nr:hypothetical protein [Botrimarina mediterranea]QDV74838.1 hypothetical protein Spa11_30470 [Botrimarina mediterranea]QDV79481.1 hypothetical protein K2D_30960 [Planctomycetes bacterium K2D]